MEVAVKVILNTNTGVDAKSFLYHVSDEFH